jgi:hypothetical protein
VHPTGGSLRVFKRFSWLEVGSVKVVLSRPAHQRVTQTVGHLRTNMTAKAEFVAKVEAIYGIYRDCEQSFGLALRDLTDLQNVIIKMHNEKSHNWSIDDLDKKEYHYTVIERDGRLNSAAVITQGEWKEKIGKNGTNIRLIGNMCLVMIYQYWEDRYRGEIAKSKGIERGELTSDLIGDIRHFRNSIIHNNSRAIAEVDRCKILKWFRAGDEIIIDSSKMDELLDQIKKELSAL